mmetsp:Transcript_31604/g.35933  ORF Transcript_31604/g.35933 Transcript_31604/m.35933 type:complete len:82 (+) Transcript_31604:205-450(+)
MRASTFHFTMNKENPILICTNLIKKKRSIGKLLDTPHHAVQRYGTFSFFLSCAFQLDQNIEFYHKFLSKVLLQKGHICSGE